MSSVLNLQRRVRELEAENEGLRAEVERLRAAAEAKPAASMTAGSKAGYSRTLGSSGDFSALSPATAEAKYADCVKCDNCDKPIPPDNLSAHQLHCLRQFSKCRDCGELLSVREAEAHAAEALGSGDALHAAALDGDRALMERMLVHGLDVDARAGEAARGETALHAACREGDRRLVEWLLQRGADIDAQSAHGETPLHVCASTKGTLKAAHALLKRGADASLRSAMRDTAFELAQRVGNHDFMLLASTRSSSSRPSSADAPASASASASPDERRRRRPASGGASAADSPPERPPPAPRTGRPPRRPRAASLSSAGTPGLGLSSSEVGVAA